MFGTIVKVYVTAPRYSYCSRVRVRL